MKVRTMLAGVAIAATALVPFVGTGSASATYSRATPTTRAQVIPIVTIDRHDPSVAHVYATYRCTVADPAHNPAELWVSVKQNDAARYDPAVAAEGAGSTGVATRWEDSHRNQVTCDGRFHIAKFTVDQLEGKQSYQTLKRGLGYVQFCLFDDTTPKGNGTTDFGQPVSSLVWSVVL